MRLPDDVYATLVRARAQVLHPPDDLELGAILNAVALAHPGYGLNHKPAGAHAVQPVTGTPVARDILHKFPENIIWDVLYDAGDGGSATPVQGDSMPAPADPERYWVAPVPVGDETDPALERRVAVLEAQVARLTELLTQGFDVSLLAHTHHWLSVLPAEGEQPVLTIEGRAQEMAGQPGAWERFYLKPR